MTIRPFASTDYDAVTGLLRDTGNFNNAELSLAQEIMEIVRTQPHQSSYLAFVAELDKSADSQVVGFLVLGQTPATVGTWDLYWIAVSPDFYGSGVAQALDAHAEALVRARKGYWLISQTSGQPRYARPRAFYRKQSYLALARIADYYAPGDDLIIFGKRLE